MKVYIAIKYHHDCRNRSVIEQITSVLEEAGYKTSCIIRDLEKWGIMAYESEELMVTAFAEIDSSDLIIIDVTEKGIGLGIEAGYAYAKGIPIYVIAHEGTEISNTMAGISEKILLYNKIEDLKILFSR
jgi:nucleoside 2-deoxyribosyltransferase